MTSTVVSRLVVKELVLNRAMIVGSLLAGLASLWISSLSRTGFNIGSVLYITTIVVLAILLVMFNVTEERKTNSLLFVLSLPLSGLDFIRAKMLGLMLAFTAPWCVLTGGALLLIDRSLIPDGLMPMTLLLSMQILTNFCILLGAAFIARSEGVIIAVMIVTNLSISLFIFMAGGHSDISRHIGSDVAVWNGTVLTILTVQLASIVCALALPFVLRKRNDDLI
jgi:hypothetical protein